MLNNNMIKNKKGVSPVIATVLLIGMVVVLALIVFVWMRALAQETVTKFGSENIELACDDVSFEASYDSGVLSVSNIGSVPIFQLSVKVSKLGSHTTMAIKHTSSEEYNWPRYGLNTGEIYSEAVSGLSGAEEIKVIPVLLGNAEDGKKRTYTCSENFGYRVI